MNTHTLLQYSFQTLKANGYSPLPIAPGKKQPAITNWSAYCGQVADDAVIHGWLTCIPNSGVGIACGLVIGIDIDDERIEQLVMQTLPQSPVQKRGKKGRTLFFRNTTGQLSKSIKRPASDEELKAKAQAEGKEVDPNRYKITMVDVLSHGRQTVVPPTVHPDTGKPYEWLTLGTLYNTSIAQLPELPIRAIDDIHGALHRGGFIPKLPEKIIPVGLPVMPKDCELSSAQRRRYEAYANVLLANCAEELAETDSGRNVALYNAVCKVGKYIHYGLLDENAVRETFLDACEANGYLGKKNGKQAFYKTLQSALKTSAGDQLPVLGEREVDFNAMFDGKPGVLPPGALAGPPKAYDRAARLEENRLIGADDGGDNRPNIMTLDEMREKLVYVEKTKEVVHIEHGKPRIWDTATGSYASSTHDLKDPETDKVKQVSALKLWLRDPLRISVDVRTWSPRHGPFCEPPEIRDGDNRAFNTWRGLRTLEAPADWQSRVRPFLDHVAYLVPVESERNRVIQWLAHIVQRPGELPHTCYLMVTTQTGIGRNWLASALVRVLRGHVAASVPLAKILDGKFNGQLAQKLLAIVDEIRTGMSDQRYERAEKLKCLITEEERRIDDKYGREWQEYNCCRWLMFSNHFDALPFDNNDRRIIVIQNPAERQAGSYYASIYRTLDEPGFAGSVRRFLETVSIADFNPGEPAPMNDAKKLALGSMSNELDKALQDFKSRYPGCVVNRLGLKVHLERDYSLTVGDKHFTHALQDLRMIPTRVRVRINNGIDRVVIVRDMTEPQLEVIHPSEIRTHIEDAWRNLRPVE